MSPVVIVLHDPREIVAALEDEALVPHPSADRAGGSTARLRDSMARFSRPEVHAGRRAAVVDAIARIDAARAEDVAFELTTARLTGGRVEAVGAIANVVPTEALATCLGFAGPFDGLVADVEAIVCVIGRGEPATLESDAAAERLLDGCSVAVVSLLYQNFDATAALVATTLGACATGERAAPAVPRTRRVAARDVSVAGRDLPAGSEVVLEIGAAGLPFGAGAHECPGRIVAERIAAGIVSAIAAAGYTVDLTGLTTDVDGRPTSVPLMPRSAERGA